LLFPEVRPAKFFHSYAYFSQSAINVQLKPTTVNTCVDRGSDKNDSRMDQSAKKHREDGRRVISKTNPPPSLGQTQMATTDTGKFWKEIDGPEWQKFVDGLSRLLNSDGVEHANGTVNASPSSE
jgi:hypothetical protein